MAVRVTGTRKVQMIQCSIGTSEVKLLFYAQTGATDSFLVKSFTASSISEDSNTMDSEAAVTDTLVLKKKKNFMAPFYGWGSTASRLEPLRGGSLLFTTKFPEVPGTHSIDLGRMKG